MNRNLKMMFLQAGMGVVRAMMLLSLQIEPGHIDDYYIYILYVKFVWFASSLGYGLAMCSLSSAATGYFKCCNADASAIA